METPTFPTTNGQRQPITVLPDEELIEAFFEFSQSDEDVEMVRLLVYAELDHVKAGAILRKCLTEGKQLVAVYQGEGDKPARKAKYIGSIIDGALYLL